MRIPPSTHASGRTLVLSFAGVAITFTLATVIAEAANLQIRSAAHAITANASPTIAILSSMRGTVRKLEVALHETIDRCGLQSCRDVPADVDQLRRSLRAGWADYQKLPIFVGEDDSWPSIERHLRIVEDDLTRIFDALGRGEVVTAQALFRFRMKPSIELLDQAIARIVQSDHEHGVALAAKIDSLAFHSIVLSIILDAASIGLTIVAAGLAISFVRREERLLRGRAEELDRFAGRVAHDVSGPLWTTSAALLVARCSLDERGRDALALAQNSVEVAQHLVKGLLEFARSGAVPAAGASEDLRHVVDVVMQPLRTLAAVNDVELQFEPSADGRVECSVGILESIVANLAGNAIKHMGRSEVRRVVIRTTPGAAPLTVRIEVEDTGPGIPASVQAHLFEPFVRGSTMGAPGFGLGLATVKRLVAGHQGQIGFTTRSGGGTLFWVDLPVARGSSSSVDAGVPEGATA